MPDLEQRFRGIDRLSAPELLSDARAKAEASARGPERRKVGTRVVTASIALALFAAAGILVWTALGPRSGTTVGSDGARVVMTTVNGVELTHPGGWTVVDLWPLARSIASWPEPLGGAIDLPEDTPERGGLPLVQLSNVDLGLDSACGVSLAGDEAVLYIAENGGPYRVTEGGVPIWPHELVPDEGPCGEGWYAYRQASEPEEGGTTSVTPYLVFAGFGPDVTEVDRDAIFRAFDSMTLTNFDDLRPPAASAAPTYVLPDQAAPPEATQAQPQETHLVASGNADDGAWQILTYELDVVTSGGAVRTWCLDFDGEGLEEEPADELRICSTNSLSEPIGAIMYVPDFRGGDALMFGEVRADVAAVEVAFPGGLLGAVDASVTPPAAPQSRAGEFVAIVPPSDRVIVIALDSAGDEMARKAISPE